MSKPPESQENEEHRWPLLGVKMPPELKEKIQTVAQMDGRTMSGWSRHVLEKAAESILNAATKDHE
jgi:hypothetical protein